MPPYVLTSAEKAELRRKYLQNVQTINSYLPDELKIRPNTKWFNDRVNDPSEQRFYKKSLEISKRVDKKLQIAISLGDKFAFMKDKKKTYAYERGIYTDMIPSDDPKAMKFNEARMKEYLLNPEAYAQRRIQNMINFNPGDIQIFADSPDLKNYLLDFYEQNEEIVDDSFRFGKTIGEFKDYIKPELKDNLYALTGNHELLGIASNAARMVKDDGYFTLPPLPQNVLEALYNSDIEFDHPELNESIKNFTNNLNSYSIVEDEFKKTMKGLRKNNIDLDSKGALTKFVGTIDIEDKKDAPISPCNYYSENSAFQGENFKLKMLDKKTVEAIANPFTKDFIKENNYKYREIPNSLEWAKDKSFRKDFVYSYALRERVEVGKVDNGNIGDLAEAIKGNWKERFFGTTSSEYKAFIKAMKAFDNPNSRHYNDKNYVYKKANKYLIHKGVKSFEDIANLEHPGNKRARLCWEVMDSYERNIKPTEDRYVRGTEEMYTLEQKPKGSPILFNKTELEDFEQDHYLEPAPTKEKVKIKVNQEDIEELSELVDAIKEPGM